MEKIAVGLFNKDVQFIEGEQITLFYNDEDAYVQLSRGLRDGYVRGEITEDWLKSHTFMQVGIFDSIDCKFIQRDNPMEVYFTLDCWQTVKDLKEEKEND